MISTELQAREDSPPPCHFTYCRPEGEHLQQGDVLCKNDQLKLVLKEHFPYYLRADFTYFIVLSQSCDLIRRDNDTCEAKYITLAAVRPLSLLLELELKGYQNDLERAAMVCSQNKKFRLEQFYERLLNNNHSEYFYLHEEPELGFPESSCAFLRLSISLEAMQHYYTCLKSRAISLTNIFQAKLGWLVGNMYSRVGTEDWVPDHLTKQEFDKRIKDVIDGLCPWIDDKKLRAANKNVPEGLLTKDLETIRNYVNETFAPSKRELALGRIIGLLTELSIVTNEEDEKRIRNHMNNDPQLSMILK
jgi:hypothetical protein